MKYLNIGIKLSLLSLLADGVIVTSYSGPPLVIKSISTGSILRRLKREGMTRKTSIVSGTLHDLFGEDDGCGDDFDEKA